MFLVTRSRLEVIGTGELAVCQNKRPQKGGRMNVDEPSEKWVDNIPNIYLIILVWTLWTLSVLFEMIAVYLLNLSHFFVLFLLCIHLQISVNNYLYKYIYIGMDLHIYNYLHARTDPEINLIQP